MIPKDYLQDALALLVPDHPNWYGWALIDSSGNKIPDDQRMQTQYVIVNSDHEGIVTRPSDEAINAKVTELENAEPLLILRQERNRKLSETDWWCCSDRRPTQAQLDYRTALRNLPATASPEIDDNGKLINVNWPEKPE